MLTGSGGQGPSNQRPPPETPPALEAAVDLSVSESRPTRLQLIPEGQGRGKPQKDPTQLLPFSEILRLCSLTLLCSLPSLWGSEAYGWEVEWEEHCLALRGAAKIYGAGFLQAGERPQAGTVEPDA